MKLKLKNNEIQFFSGFDNDRFIRRELNPHLAQHRISSTTSLDDQINLERISNHWGGGENHIEEMTHKMN